MGRQTHGDGIALGNRAEKIKVSSGLLNAFRCREPQRTFPLIFFLFVALNVVVVTTGYVSRVSSAECPSAAVPLKATMKTKLMEPEHQRRSAQTCVFGEKGNSQTPCISNKGKCLVIAYKALTRLTTNAVRTETLPAELS